MAADDTPIVVNAGGIVRNGCESFSHPIERRGIDGQPVQASVGVGDGGGQGRLISWAMEAASSPGRR